MNGLKKQLKNEYLFSIITRFFVIAISMLQSIVVARYLGASLKGTSAYISSIASIGAIVVTFGMHQAYPFFRNKYGKDSFYNKYVNITYFIFLCYLIFAILLSIAVLDTPELRAASVLIPIMGYANVVGYVCLIERPNRRNCWWTFITVIDFLVVVILWCTTASSFAWAVFILIFADALKAVVYTIDLHVKPQFIRDSFPFFKELIGYGFFPMLALLMTTLNYRIDVLMLKQYSYISVAQIGIYSIGISFAEKIVLVPDTLAGILASKLAKGSNENEVVKISRISFWASLFMCMVFLLLGEWAIPFLYGSEYTGSFNVLALSAIGSLFIGYFKLISQYNIIHKKQIYNVMMLSVAIVVDVIGNLALIPIWGINGAALATGLGNLVCGAVFVCWFAKKASVPVTKMIVPQKEDFLLLTKFLCRKKQ